MNREAIFSDTTANFITPAEPEAFDRVTIYCRTAKGDADSVTVIVNGIPHFMKKEGAGGGNIFDVYTTQLMLGKEPIYYYFKIQSGEETVIFNKEGVCEEPKPYFYFCIFPGRKTPNWAKGAVMYQIFVDRFCNGDKNNDVVNSEYSYIDEHVTQVKDWNKMPASMGFREFYGGDLKGVWSKLDYLQDLGVEVLYLNPIFVSPSNHKYDTQDYDHVDPHYGVILDDGGEVLPDGDNDNSHATKYIKRVVNRKNLEASNEFFAKFVEEVHRRGMKVILDGVFNHCGSFNKWMDREKIYNRDESYAKGAFLTEDSPYRDFFHFNSDGEWPDNTHYNAWWGNDTLPKLNYESSDALEEYILGVAKKWISPPYNVDGWRLDVAADLGQSQEYNHRFWKKFHAAVKSVNPEAIILAEHYGDASPWMDGSQWDTIMNYDAFMEPVGWFLTGMDKHSDVYYQDRVGNAGFFWDTMRNFGARFSMSAAQTAMNELSNHDHSRFLTRTNHTVGRTAFAGPMAASMGINKAVMRLGVVIQMTWIGAPTVYYGDEVGVCGWTDPDNRRTYPWGHEDMQMLSFHKEMIRIHKDYQAFKTGSTIYLKNEPNLVGYGRFDDKDKIFVLVQVGGYERNVDVDVWRLGMENGQQMVCMIETNQSGYTLKSEMRSVVDGRVTVHLQENGAVVYKSIDIH